MIPQILSLFLLSTSFNSTAALESSTPRAVSPFFSQHNEIQTNELKRMMETNKDLILVDARKRKNDDGYRIGNARLVPPDAPPTHIRAALPSKSSTIVVYCASAKCPASVNLARRLISMGYEDVHVYKAGIKGWVNAGNKMNKI